MRNRFARTVAIQGIQKIRFCKKNLILWTLTCGTLLAAFGGSDHTLVAATTRSNRSYEFFAGRTKLVLPTGASAPKRINKNTFLIQPKDPSKKFAIFISREPLQRDEIKISKSQLGNSIRRLLESQGYSFNLFSSRGRDFRSDFSTFAVLPWQPVGTTPARGLAKFIRTADNYLIGSVLMCEPKQWLDPEIAKYKRLVSRLSVSQR